MRQGRVAALLCACVALSLHYASAEPLLWRAAVAEPPWAPGRASMLASGSAGDAPAPFVVTASAGAEASDLFAVCNRTRASLKQQQQYPRPSLMCQLQLGGLCRHVYTRVTRGFAGTFRPSQLRALQRCAPGLMELIEHDAPVSVDATAVAATRAAPAAGAAAPPVLPLPTLGAPARVPWSLDRLDQRATPLDGRFAPRPDAGAGVSVYIVDSGVRGSHDEFRRRSAVGSAEASSSSTSRVTAGADFTKPVVAEAVGDATVAQDCDGHGTHVAATVAGARVGVAPAARLVSVRVLDCDGNGRVSDVVAGIDWVARHAQLPAVATLSLGIPRGDWSRALEDSVRSLVRDAGVFTTVAAGNSQGDACTVVPACVSDAVTVGASDLSPRYRQGGVMALQPGNDTLYSWTDTGRCVDLFAPGVDVVSACGGAKRCGRVSDSAYSMSSGTSMAAPHVAGVAAEMLSRKPAAKPAEVKAALLEAATRGRIMGSMLPGTPNLLLFQAETPVAVLAAGGL